MTATAASPRIQPAARSLRRRRSSRRLLIAVVLGVLGALMAVYAYRAAVPRDGVIALARPLASGAEVQLSDLREARLPSDTGLATTPWTDVDEVVGLLAASELRTGQILTPDSVTAERVPAPGEAVVGLSVEAGHAPSTGLEPRDQVLVVLGTRAPPRRAVIVEAGETDISGRRTFDVLVPQADAEELALASVEGRAAIVLIGRG